MACQYKAHLLPLSAECSEPYKFSVAAWDAGASSPLSTRPAWSVSLGWALSLKSRHLFPVCKGFSASCAWIVAALATSGLCVWEGVAGPPLLFRLQSNTAYERHSQRLCSSHSCDRNILSIITGRPINAGLSVRNYHLSMHRLSTSSSVQCSH